MTERKRVTHEKTHSRLIIAQILPHFTSKKKMITKKFKLNELNNYYNLQAFNLVCHTICIQVLYIFPHYFSMFFLIEICFFYKFDCASSSSSIVVFQTHNNLILFHLKITNIQCEQKKKGLSKFFDFIFFHLSSGCFLSIHILNFALCLNTNTSRHFFFLSPGCELNFHLKIAKKKN